jgi:hypothetical protein
VGDDGAEHFDDPHAVWIGPEGVECDVVLQPLGQSVTALWGEGGDVTDIAPIHAGDQVVVEFPDGNLMGGKILCIIKSRSNKQPMISGTPIFDNKRRLIYAKKGELDLRTAGADGKEPAQLLIDQASTITSTATRINLGDKDVTEQAVKGTSFRSAEDQLFSDMLDGVAMLITASQGPFSGLIPGFQALQTALTMFGRNARANNSFLSDTVFLK